MGRERNERYVISQVLTLRNRLFEQVAGTFLDQIVQGSRFVDLVQLVIDNLPQSVIVDAVEESLRHLAGRRLNREVLYETCWRLAGNLPRLARNLAVMPWTSQTQPEWSPLQIERARRARNKRMAFGCLYNMRIVAGTCCPLIIQKFWTMRFLRFVASDFGFSKPWMRTASGSPKYPFVAPEQFVLLRFSARIDPELSSRQNGPMFSAINLPSSLLTWNHEQLKRRARVDVGYSCPAAYPDDFDCHRCPHGYRTTCRAAVHPFEYEFKVCPRCHEEAPFDDFISRTVCVVCHNEQVFNARG